MIDDGTGVGDQLALHDLRRAIGPNIGADARRYRQIDVDGGFEPQRQQDIAGRHVAGLDADRPYSVGERAHRRAQAPRPLGIVGLKPEDHAALRGPRQARVDPIERPRLAVAPIVDHEIAVLEAEFAQFLAVEAGGAGIVDPGHDTGRVLDIRTQRRLRRGGVGRQVGARRTERRRGDGDRPLVGAGEHGHAAVGLDPHRQLGADQIEALRPHLPHQQAHAGQADLGLRRARHHRAVDVAHDNVAQAQGGAALLVAFDLGSADSHRLLAIEILLDRGFQPGRRQIEFNRAAAQPPPQSEKSDGRHRHADRRRPEQPAQVAMAQKPDGAAPQHAPAPAARTMCGMPMRCVARGRSVVDWMLVSVLFAGHALKVCLCMIRHGRTIAQRGPGTHIG